MHRAVLHDKSYIKFASEHAVEVITMEEISRAVAEGPHMVRTYKTEDAYGDEVEYLSEFPGVTLEQLITISSDHAPAIEYMEGGRIPYHAILDPHEMTVLESLQGKRGPKEMMKIISRHEKTLKEKYGPGISRRLWREVGKAEIASDGRLAERDVAGAMKLYRATSKLAPKPPERVRIRLEAIEETILEDANKQLNEAAALMSRDSKKEARTILTKLAPALKGTPLDARVKELLGK